MDAKSSSRSYYIPEDITRDIFSKLPVKSLIRFQSLSKDCAKLFKTPAFISEHRLQSHRNSSLLFTSDILDERRLYSIQTHKIKEEIKRVHCPKSHLPFDGVIGCCNGLICLCYGPNDNPRMFLIWNPATKEFREIELPKNYWRNRNTWKVRHGLGFGFSATLNDYKIVTQEGVYSLNTDTWRKISLPCYVRYEPAVCANGALFWEGQNKIQKPLLISFDIEKEVFSEIKLPPGMDKLHSFDLTLYNDSLAILHNTYTEQIGVWVMDKKGAIGESFTWIKLFTLAPFSISLFFCLSSWRGKFLIVTYSETQEPRDYFDLSLCSPNSNELNHLSFQWFGNEIWLFEYAESLVPINS